ncbi:hypothetical protein C8R41DRAFT_835610 [Lentinula lateritia]|uniref:Uncharacterized protein n=1 Tax=Lentinula lateritia TaxID=40482 RepID=A0ABQ8VFQ7_9AGAR|nr:hypothetical protein C8R41DRAFT_835610 [Lentinula lateritia]
MIHVVQPAHFVTFEKTLSSFPSSIVTLKYSVFVCFGVRVHLRGVQTSGPENRTSLSVIVSVQYPGYRLTPSRDSSRTMPLCRQRSQRAQLASHVRFHAFAEF